MLIVFVQYFFQVVDLLVFLIISSSVLKYYIMRQWSKSTLQANSWASLLIYFYFILQYSYQTDFHYSARFIAHNYKTSGCTYALVTNKT